MFRKAHTAGLLTGLIAAAMLTGGTASAQQAYAFLPPQPLFLQAVPPQISEPRKSSTASEVSSPGWHGVSALEDTR